MLGMRAFLDKQKWARPRCLKEIEADSRKLLDEYNPDYRYYAECLQKEKVEKRVLYESGNGKNQLLTLKKLFEAFVMRPDFKEYQHIWVFHEKKEYKAFKKECEEYENVKFWLIEGQIPHKYYRLLATACYLFQGGNFPAVYVKRDKQYFLRIREFHPKREVGFEGDSDGYQIANYMRGMLMADAILARDETACRRLEAAYRLNGVYRGSVLIADARERAPEILETVLDKKESVPHTEDFATDKTTLLIYGGGMAMNGVTEALLALLKSLDYDKYDVTVCCWMQDSFYSRGNIARIDRRARVLVTRGTDPMTQEEQLRTLYLKRNGLRHKEAEKIYRKSRQVIKRAVLRRFGNASFDYLIDFSGYAVWVPLLFLEMPAKRRFIWEHQDLKEDFNTKNERQIGNKDVKLEGLLSIYERFDYIVAVNQSLMKLNREKLGNEDTKGKFRFASNIIDRQRLEEKIARCGADSVLEGKDGQTYLVYDCERSSVDGTIKMLPMAKKDGQFDFVTVGRLSQEKNHAGLIRAFGEFLTQYPQSRLFIIGHGVLKEELQELVIKHKWEKNVIFTGNLTNPYLLMKHCDCFVFPSYYEGQGLVVLEARMLHMPIVMSDYSVASEVCVENGQYMTDMTADGILQGLLAYANGEVPGDYEFDLDKYNQKAAEEFYRALED